MQILCSGLHVMYVSGYYHFLLCVLISARLHHYDHMLKVTNYQNHNHNTNYFAS